MKVIFILLFRAHLTSLIPGRSFWPYFAGAALLIIGLARIIKGGELHARGIDKAVAFGSLFFTVPMAVFGADHFIASKIVAATVPSWIPGHLFWVYLVGTALFAASLSIATKKHSVLAASLLSAMIFSFVLLIHVPNFAANPRNRFMFAIVLRDSSFSSGALACALAQAGECSKQKLNWLTVLVRYVIALPSVIFGAEHFLYPDFVPVVPLKQPLPSWIPGHLFLAYATGAVLIAAGFSLLFNWKARLAATWLGIFVFVIVLLVYLPIMIAKLSDIGNGLNYFADTLAFSGTALLIGGALSNEDHSAAPLTGREPITS
jgi:uncharacterized membrane protein